MNIEIPGFKTSRDFPSKNKLITVSYTHLTLPTIA